MSALVELYLRDYHELEETRRIDYKLLSKIDLDNAMSQLEEFYTTEEWLIIKLFCDGYSYREISEIMDLRFGIVRKTQRVICRAIAKYLGWEYSDARIHALVAKKLHVVRLTEEEGKFVQIKLNNHSNFKFKEYTIHNFAFDPFGRVVLRQ